MKKKKEKPIPFYEILGKFIRNNITFDLEEGNENNYKRIQELIAYKLLISWGWTIREIQYQFPFYVNKIRVSFYRAIKYLENGDHENRAVSVYTWSGGKINDIVYERVITGVTIDEEYKNSKDKDFKRVTKRFESAGNSLINDINNKYPEKKKELGLPVAKIIKGLGGTGVKKLEYKKK